MTPLEPGIRPVPPSRLRSARRWVFRLSAFAAAVGIAAGLASCGAPNRSAKPAGDETASTLVLPRSLFRSWPKPDLALVLSGSMHGYLLPCGCSRPQVGGLERRYNFVQILKQKGWPLVAVDVGDVAQREGPVKLPNHQGLIKYRYAMNALQHIGYSAVGFGEFEAALSLDQALGEWALNNPSPSIVVSNLKDADTNFPGETKKWELAKVAGTDLTVGIAGLVGPTVAGKIKDPKVKFGSSKEALQDVLTEMDGSKVKVDLRVLLYQGSQTVSADKNFGAEAVACAKAFPQFDVILCLNEEDEPSSLPVWVPDAKTRKTLVVALGHKGKYIGVVGANRTGKPEQPFDLRYELVEMSEAFLTPEDREQDHPIVKLMEDYTRELHDRKLLNSYGQMRHSLQVAVKDKAGRLVTPLYIGSDKCKKCHDSAYAVWDKTPHRKAYQTLVDSKHPSNRQFDAECIVCHTVGFGYLGGFKDADTTPHLENVGCESCHGPGSEHAAHPNNKQWQTLMNVWHAPDVESAEAKTKRHDRIDHFCQSCHDIDNDVTWKDNAFPRKWKKIAHPTIPE